ncbi:MAG: hypothetical protein GX230_11580 [Lentisphaerae bacterium]|jgi:hypothetical protein|nr:hypothetical protein [Lentisphaerota bacterium]
MSRFITGIYNYCDYWCARCPLTQRCRNYIEESDLERLQQAVEEEELEDHDAANREFWDKLAVNLREATVFGKKAPETDEWEASRPSIDFGDFESDDEYMAREQAINKAVHEHLLNKLSKEYLLSVRDWFKSKQTDKDLKTVAKEWLAQAGQPFDKTDYEEAALEVRDLLDVVGWYHTLISPKLYRALRGLLDEFEGDSPVAEIIQKSRQSDANGSAKVALIAIERSMAAWLRLMELLPQQEDIILEFLVLLQRMQKGIHTELPGAITFIRPGFDPGTNFLEAEDDPEWL